MSGETENTIAAIYRYPVKGLSPEKLDRTTLAPGECLPHDRRFAIALPDDPLRSGNTRNGWRRRISSC